MVLAILAVIAPLAVIGGAALLGSQTAERLHARYSREARTRRALERHARQRERQGIRAAKRFDQALPPLDVEIQYDEADWRGWLLSGRSSGEHPQPTGNSDPGPAAIEALRILEGGEPNMSVESYVVTTRADTRILRALLQHPGAHARTQAAAAVYLKGQGIGKHVLVEERYLAAAGAYRDSLANWPEMLTEYATGQGMTENVEHVMELLDPVLRETYVGIATGWNGDVKSAIEAARCVLTP